MTAARAVGDEESSQPIRGGETRSAGDIREGSGEGHITGDHSEAIGSYEIAFELVHKFDGQRAAEGAPGGAAGLGEDVVGSSGDRAAKFDLEIGFPGDREITLNVQLSGVLPGVMKELLTLTFMISFPSPEMVALF